MEKLIALLVNLKKKGFFHLIISNYSIQFIVFGSHLLVAKIMNPADVGMIKTIETYSNMAIVLGGGGMIFAILKVIPQNTDKVLRSISLKYSLKYVLFFSFAVFAFFNLLGYLKLLSDQKDLVRWFQIYSLIIVPSVAVMLLIRYYQAINQFKRISTIIFFLKMISAAFVLLFTYFFFIRGYVISMVGTTMITAAVLLYDLKKEIRTKTFSEKFFNLKKEILSLSKTAFFAQLIDQLKLHSGFIIASYVISDQIMFGHYSFSLILIQGLNIISTSVQQFIIPKMSKNATDLRLFFKEHKKTEFIFLVSSITIFLIAQLILPLIVSFVFNNKYDDSIPLLRIMLVGWLIQAFYALKGVVFLSLGKMKYVAYASLKIFLVSFPIMYFLNLKYGAYGAAYSYVFQNIISFLSITYYTNMVSKIEQ